MFSTESEPLSFPKYISRLASLLHPPPLSPAVEPWITGRLCQLPGMLFTWLNRPFCPMSVPLRWLPDERQSVSILNRAESISFSVAPFAFRRGHLSLSLCNCLVCRPFIMHHAARLHWWAFPRLLRGRRRASRVWLGYLRFAHRGWLGSKPLSQENKRAGCFIHIWTVLSVIQLPAKVFIKGNDAKEPPLLLCLCVCVCSEGISVKRIHPVECRRGQWGRNSRRRGGK